LLALPPTLSMGFVSVFSPLLKKKGGKKKGVETLLFVLLLQEKIKTKV
jgi:cyanate permease